MVVLLVCDFGGYYIWLVVLGLAIVGWVLLLLCWRFAVCARFGCFV